MDQRLEAVKRVEAGESVTSVAERLGVSRQAVYNWIALHATGGDAGLAGKSRRPHRSPNKTVGAVEQALIAERQRWGFGAKQILRRCQDSHPEMAWPRRSTVDAIFKRNGLVAARPKARRRVTPGATARSIPATGSGEVVTIDYKGQVRMGDGRLCYALTIVDPFSRYVLACDAYHAITFKDTWASLVRVFSEWGVPARVHSDNGVPFGTSGHGRFSMLSVRLMKYGVVPTYNRPGKPQDNGSHERMHKTLLERAMIPAGADLSDQQQRCDEFRQMFNHERPHESLDLDRPACRHHKSAREFPSEEPQLVYDKRFEQRRVDARGRIRWGGQQLFFSEAFANETVAFEPTSYTTWRIHYSSFQIGEVHANGRIQL